MPGLAGLIIIYRAHYFCKIKLVFLLPIFSCKMVAGGDIYVDD